MKRIGKTIFLCLLCMVFGVFFTACFFDNKTEEPDEADNTTYTLYVYSVDDSYLRAEKVTRGKESYVYFGDGRYTFHGYFTEKNGNGNQITDSTGKVLKDFKEPSSSTAFPIYPYVSQISYTLTFVTNCSQTLSPQTHTADEAFDLPAVSKTGFQFLGWNTSSDSWWGIKDVYAGQYTQDTTLYAIFKAASSRVTYYKGLHSDYDSIEISYGENYTVPYTEETGYNFVGYYTQQNGQGEKLTDSNGNSVSPWSIAEDRVNIYAHYQTAETFTLKIANDGLVTGIEVTYKNWVGDFGQLVDHTVFYSDGQTIASLVPKNRNGYYFDGWYKDYSCRNEYDFTLEENISNELELYAKWVALPGTAPKNILSTAADGYISLNYFDVTENDMKFFCDFSGTFTVHYQVKSFAGEGETQGADVSIGSQFSGTLASGESGTVEVTVRKGDVWGITGRALKYGENPKLFYRFENLPEVASQKKVQMPTELTYTVTAGNRFKLPVYQKTGYTFVGYFDKRDGRGLRITDNQGNSIDVWNDSEDLTVYAYYI